MSYWEDKPKRHSPASDIVPPPYTGRHRAPKETLVTKLAKLLKGGKGK